MVFDFFFCFGVVCELCYFVDGDLLGVYCFGWVGCVLVDVDVGFWIFDDLVLVWCFGVSFGFDD